MPISVRVICTLHSLRNPTHHFLMLEGLQVFEFPLGSLVPFGICFVENFDAANFAAMIDVGCDVEAALEQITKEIDLSRASGG